MNKICAQIFLSIGFCVLVFGLISVPWYIFGDLTNPVPQMFFPGIGIVGAVFRWFLGLAVYLLSSCFVYLSCKAAARISIVGWRVFIAEEKNKEAIAKKNAIRDAGTLIAVSVESGGLLDSATTMIETSEGFYRVFGKVDMAIKGEKVMIRKDSRGFFGFEMLCLAGKEYQLTK